ncbi:unnamed protein product [Leptidea sinapis]|uniref:Protein kinase domain-containing protein n=1 Tax=Leptidea sinapis TaxID=189913 RepID=A0A5E4QKF5_9NEOP|nr:unnamed protein product [Leptidea sinapis]
MSEFKTPTKSKLQENNDNITIPPSPFLHKLGYGTGVSVLQLVRSPRAGLIRSPWALKMLNKRVKPNKVYKERLQAEADLLKRLSHPNIVGFRAFSNRKILYLGMESCDLSLGDMIEKKVEDDCEPFAAKYIIKVATDIGSALDYLHTKIQILHGDIKSYNVLVNGNFIICKLCDFGVTVPLDENGVFDKENNKNVAYYGTEAWSAPEVLNDGLITCKTDIWSLGLTLWEMLSLAPPHTVIDEDSDASVTSMDDSYMNDAFERYGTRPEIPANITIEEYSDALSLFHACTEADPSLRPSGLHLATAAAEMLNNIQTPDK